MGRPKGSKNKPKEERQIVVPFSQVETVKEEPKKRVSQATKKGRSYERTNIGDVVYMHKSRNTGALVAVLRGPAELGVGTAAKWIDMCLAHHQFAIYDARTKATAEANKSDDWCATCSSLVSKKKSTSA